MSEELNEEKRWENLLAMTNANKQAAALTPADPYDPRTRWPDIPFAAGLLRPYEAKEEMKRAAQNRRYYAYDTYRSSLFSGGHGTSYSGSSASASSYRHTNTSFSNTMTDPAYSFISGNVWN